VDLGGGVILLSRGRGAGGWRSSCGGSSRCSRHLPPWRAGYFVSIDTRSSQVAARRSRSGADHQRHRSGTHDRRCCHGRQGRRGDHPDAHQSEFRRMTRRMIGYCPAVRTYLAAALQQRDWRGFAGQDRRRSGPGFRQDAARQLDAGTSAQELRRRCTCMCWGVTQAFLEGAPPECLLLLSVGGHCWRSGRAAEERGAAEVHPRDARPQH